MSGGPRLVVDITATVLPFLRGSRQATLRRTRRSDTVTTGVSDRRQLLLEASIERRPGNPQGLADFPDGGALICGQRLQLFNLAGTYSSTAATAGRLSFVLGAAVVGVGVVSTGPRGMFGVARATLPHQEP